MDSVSAGKIYTGGGGSRGLFKNDGFGGFIAPAGVNARLVVVGSNLELSFYESGMKQIFDGANGRLIAQSDRDEDDGTVEAENRISFTYDGSGQLAKITDTRGRDITFTYTSGRITKVTDWTGRQVTYGYTSGRLTTVTDADNMTVTYTYNATTGNLEQITDASAQQRQTKFTYTADDRIQTVKRVNNNGTGAGDTTTYDYFIGNSECRPAEPFLAASGKGCTKVTDARLKATYHQWTYAGTVERTIDPLGKDQTTAWTSNNQIESYTDAAGAQSTIGYDNNRPATSTAATGNQTSYAYSGSIPATNSRNYWKPSSVTDAQSNQTTMGYDPAGNQTSATRTTGGASQTTTATYTSDGSVDYVNDPRSSGPSDTTYRTDYTYNALGELTTIDHPAPRADETFTYDGLSRAATHTDGNGTTVTYTYDPIDRVKTATYTRSGQTTVTITNTYDANGNLTARVDPAGTWGFAFDTQNRLTTKSGPSQPTQKLTYDAVGNLATWDEDDTGPLTAVTYSYDDRNQVDTVTLPGVGTPIDADHDDAMRRTVTKYPNGVWERVNYDDAGRIQRIWATKGNSTLTDFTYTYNKAGADQALRQQVTDKAGNTTRYTYDALNRLDTAQQTNSSNAVVNTWDYDYDKAGNITLATRNGVSYSAAYNAASQPCWAVAATTVAACGSTPPAGRTDFGHDANGNMTATGAQQFTYNTRNQTGSITPPSGGTATAMSYAGGTQDERLTRGLTGFVTGPMGLATETTATSATRYRYDDTGTLLARQGPGGSSDTQYYLRDGLGSIVALTDTAGNVAASYTYDPYGITTTNGTTLATTNPWRYAAGYTDTTTGLTKFGTRYYNPNLGRWTQPDHWGPETGYTYAGNNPINRTDLTGRLYLDISFTVGPFSFGTDTNEDSSTWWYAGGALPPSLGLSITWNSGEAIEGDTCFSGSLILAIGGTGGYCEQGGWYFGGGFGFDVGFTSTHS